VQAEVEGEAGVAARAPADKGGLDRLAGAGEDGEDAVAEELAFDRRTCMLANGGAERRVSLASS